ncbi:MAG TPA: hypothetical protein VFF73_07770 [Planctomycetota bacterium]|nr:hypothetical protein [Planctomycetota bacterium]
MQGSQLRTLAAAACLVISVVSVRADDSLQKKKEELEKKLHALGHELAEKHASFGRKLDEAGRKNDAFLERLLALELSPDEAAVREALGYKKEGDAWQGAPDRPPAVDAPLPEKLAKDRAELRRSAQQKLVELAKRAQKDGLEAEARRLAGLALDEDGDSTAARQLLHHEKKEGLWISPHEIAVRAAFSACLSKVKVEDKKPEGDDAALVKTLGIGDGSRRETEHFAVYAMKDADEQQLDAIARAGETCWDAIRFYLGGENLGFTLAAPELKTKGKSVAVGRLRGHIVTEKVYPDVVDRVLTDKEARELAKKDNAFHERTRLESSSQAWVLVTDEDTEDRAEILSMMVVDAHMDETVNGDATCPDAILEGLRRFFAGHATGRAFNFYSGLGSSSLNKQEHAGKPFPDFRALVRPALTASLEGDLRALLTKAQGDFELRDVLMSFAFVDFLLNTRRDALIEFLGQLRQGVLPTDTLEAVFKTSVRDLERELHEWVRQEY